MTITSLKTCADIEEGEVHGAVGFDSGGHSEYGVEYSLTSFGSILSCFIWDEDFFKARCHAFWLGGRSASARVAR